MSSTTAMIRSFALIVTLATIAWTQDGLFPGEEGETSCGKTSKPKVIKSFSNGSPVYGAVSADGLVYVIRENSSKIQLYESNNKRFESVQPLDVLKKEGLYDMAYLPHRNSLALLNWFDSHEVFVVSLQPPHEMKRFTFTEDSTVAALAVGATNDGDGDDDTIIITESNKYVKEYSPDGKLLLKFELKINETPRQTIKLSNNIYATTFGYERNEGHYVCRFNNNGYVIGKCFGGKPGDSSKQVDVPARMILSPDKESILLADMRNKRIMKLKQDLSSGEVLLDAADGISQPYRIYLDEEDCLLYVADNELNDKGWAVAGRVLVFRY